MKVYELIALLRTLDTDMEVVHSDPCGMNYMPIESACVARFKRNLPYTEVTLVNDGDCTFPEKMVILQ